MTLKFIPRFFQPTEAITRRDTKTLDRQIAEAEPVYLFSEQIILGVNIAFATGRPLLLSGPPGSGKSTLARAIAEVKKFRFLQYVVSSRTQAQDLLSGFDAIRRLNDAQDPKRSLLPRSAYVEPGIFWWAFDAATAASRGEDRANLDALVTQGFPLASDPSKGAVGAEDAVLLIDEIDKADPDVPNDLLEPLERLEFTVQHSGLCVQAKKTPFVLFTTNGERDLPPAFVRRCVSLELTAVTPERLIEIGQAHFGAERIGLLKKIAAMFAAARSNTAGRGIREPSTAEYIDTVRACIQMGVDEQSATLDTIANFTAWKLGNTPADSL